MTWMAAGARFLILCATMRMKSRLGRLRAYLGALPSCIAGRDCEGRWSRSSGSVASLARDADSARTRALQDARSDSLPLLSNCSASSSALTGLRVRAAHHVEQSAHRLLIVSRDLFALSSRLVSDASTTWRAT